MQVSRVLSQMSPKKSCRILQSVIVIVCMKFCQAESILESQHQDFFILLEADHCKSLLPGTCPNSSFPRGKNIFSKLILFLQFRLSEASLICSGRDECQVLNTSQGPEISLQNFCLTCKTLIDLGSFCSATDDH